MGLYKEGIKTWDCCINPETSKFSISAEQGVDQSHLLIVLVHTLFILHLHMPQISQRTGTGVWELLLLFSSSLDIHNVGSEGLIFFHLLPKPKSLSAGDSAVCAQ